MKCIETKVKDCLIYELDVFEDHRGFLTEMFSRKHCPFEPKQINWSHSKINVLRGIHVAPYAKLVTCVEGDVFDVCVDLRPESPTYMKWDSVNLLAKKKKQIYIPAHCGHAFMGLCPYNIVVYLMEEEYNPDKEWTVNYRDPKLKISWPYAGDYIVSAKDWNAKKL